MRWCSCGGHLHNWTVSRTRITCRTRNRWQRGYYNYSFVCPAGWELKLISWRPSHQFLGCFVVHSNDTITPSFLPQQLKLDIGLQTSTWLSSCLQYSKSRPFTVRFKHPYCFQLFCMDVKRGLLLLKCVNCKCLTTECPGNWIQEG